MLFCRGKFTPFIPYALYQNYRFHLPSWRMDAMKAQNGMSVNAQ